MKTIIKTSCNAALAIILTGCGSTDNGFTSSSSSSSNVISAGNFSIGFDPSTVAVLSFTTPPTGISGTQPCTNLTGITGSVESKITATAADKDNARVSSGRVYFNVEYGTLDKNYCDLKDGQCTVTWTSHTNISVLTSALDTFSCLFLGIGTVDPYNSVTAWTYGAEHFTDSNGDGRLSGTESFIDTDEPYLDRNDNRVFDSGIDNLTSSDTNGIHEGPDGIYNGPDCDTTTRADCGGALLIPIYDSSNLILY